MKLFNPNATGSLAVTGSANITEDLTVGGVITAQEFHTEFISASIIYDSGSTQFGNSLDDAHNFSGSLAVNTNNLFVSGGNVGIGTISPKTTLQINKNSTSGASGGITIKTADSNESLLSMGVSTSLGRAFISSLQNGTGTQLPLDFITGNSSTNVRMSITSSGNVGIGTTSPTTKLDVVGNTSTAGVHFMRGTLTVQKGGSFNNSRTVDIEVDASDQPRIYSSFWTTEASLRLGTYSTKDAITIEPDGDVGINTTSPSYKLHVNGSVAGVGAYVNLSDIDYKKNIYDLTDGLDKVLQLRPVTFSWKNEEYGDRINTGFIAQEVEDVLPNSVITTEDSVKSIATSELIAVLTKAVQELKAEVNELRSEINILKGVS